MSPWDVLDARRIINRFGPAAMLNESVTLLDGECLVLARYFAEVEEVLNLMDWKGERQGVKAPEDAEVRALCERVGYGAVMDSAARQWRAKSHEQGGSGAFMVGPNAGAVAALFGRSERAAPQGERAKRKRSEPVFALWATDRRTGEVRITDARSYTRFVTRKAADRKCAQWNEHAERFRRDFTYEVRPIEAPTNPQRPGAAEGRE